MITTPGKIPNEMYYLEDTTPNGIGTIAAYGTELHTVLNNSYATTLASTRAVKSDESEHSMLLCILVIALFIILLMCCIAACIIARSRSKHTFFIKRDIECSPECSGVNQPLLGMDKTSDTTTKTSVSSAQNWRGPMSRCTTTSKYLNANYHRNCTVQDQNRYIIATYLLPTRRKWFPWMYEIDDLGRSVWAYISSNMAYQV